MNNEVEKLKKKKSSAKEVAAAMIKNMTKNMNDPNFYSDHERLLSRETAKIIKKREQRKKNQNT